MLRKDFSFDLPQELVAQYPAPERGHDRLLVLDRSSGAVTHSSMDSLPEFIEPGTVFVFNNSRVRKARVYAECSPPGKKPFRGELLFLDTNHTNLTNGTEGPSFTNGFAGGRWRVMLRRARKIAPGTRFVFDDGREAVSLDSPDLLGTEFREISFDAAIDEAWFEKNGRVPLPPYIKREDSPADSERYQTVYARETGSIASPTAGLHFTEELLARLRDSGVQMEWVTLHVGLGTFLPVREERVEDHAMHEERYTVPAATAARLNAAKREGRKIIACGTTSARTLEAAWGDEGVKAGPGRTRIFIYPGYAFRAIDGLFTNFHTPESTLLMLVCAFAGQDNIFAAYREAIARGYRFFSYGDAMLIVTR